MLLKILAVLGLSILTAVVAIVVKSKREEARRTYAAAERILQNEILDASLKNPFLKETVVEEQPEKQLMMSVKVKRSKKRQNFVFNPARVVNIGRDRANNQIAVNEATVSNYHCRIYLAQNDKAVIQDCNSSNGTLLKRGLRTFVVANGQNAVLADGDKLVVGTVTLKIRLFYYDAMWM